MLADKLSMSPEDAEKWIVNLIRKFSCLVYYYLRFNRKFI